MGRGGRRGRRDRRLKDRRSPGGEERENGEGDGEEELDKELNKERRTWRGLEKKDAEGIEK